MNNNFITETEQLVRDTKATFGNLGPVQLNWKPSGDQWSVGQCFDHLLTANQAYLPIFEKIGRGEKETRLWERVPLLPNLFGKILMKAVAPEGKRKFKAPQTFRPSSSAIDAGIIEKFIAQQEEVISLMHATSKLHTEKIILTSPASNLVTLSLRDAYAIMLSHGKRHFLQAQRVLQSDNFPH